MFNYFKRRKENEEKIKKRFLFDIKLGVFQMIVPDNTKNGASNIVHGSKNYAYGKASSVVGYSHVTGIMTTKEKIKFITIHSTSPYSPVLPSTYDEDDDQNVYNYCWFRIEDRKTFNRFKRMFNLKSKYKDMQPQITDSRICVCCDYFYKRDEVEFSLSYVGLLFYQEYIHDLPEYFKETINLKGEIKKWLKQKMQNKKNSN